MHRTGALTGIWSRREIQFRLMQYDWVLLGAVGTLLAWGAVLVFSASFYEGLLRAQPDGLYFFKRQLLWLALGLGVLIGTALIPYAFWARVSGLLFTLSLVSLLVVLLVGTQAFGSQRLLFGTSFQPSEFTKLAVILYSSHWMVSKGDRLRDYNSGLIPYGLMIGLVSVLIFLQPDISMTMLIGMTAFALFYMASGNLKHMLVVALVAAVTTGVIVLVYPYLGERISDFVRSIQDPVNSAGWQERNSVRATIRGGLFGTGVGRGEMKTLWLVLPWTDAIYAVIGEETGLWGSLLILFLLGLIAYRGLSIAYGAPTEFGTLVGIGLVFLLAVQSLVHIGVVLSLIPVAGVTLPFVSYGGSSLLVWMASVGLLVNIDHARRVQPAA